MVSVGSVDEPISTDRSLSLGRSIVVSQHRLGHLPRSRSHILWRNHFIEIDIKPLQRFKQFRQRRRSPIAVEGNGVILNSPSIAGNWYYKDS